MHWPFPLPIQAPLANLPRQSVEFTGRLQLGLTLSFSSESSTGNFLSPYLQKACSDDSLVCSIKYANFDEQFLPGKLWAAFTPSNPDKQLADNPILLAELMVACKLMTEKDISSQYTKEDIVKKVQQFLSYEALYQVICFALFENDQLSIFAPENRLFKAWDDARTRVIHDRGVLGKKPNVGSTLLQQGYDFLEMISRLHERLLSTQEMDVLWSDFSAQHSQVGQIYKVLFCAEKTYCLTEQGLINQGRTALDEQQQALTSLLSLVHGISDKDLDAGMWNHHQGRLAYYDGNFTYALQLYANEYPYIDRLSEVNQARLMRNCANVLSDLGYLDQAAILTEKALDIHILVGDTAEIFKSSGRLAEIKARQSCYAEAVRLFTKSWQHQNDDTESSTDNKTAIYLGHSFLLQGSYAEAENWYQQSAVINESFNPYLSMGWSALFLRTGKMNELSLMWNKDMDAINKLSDEKVLPKAVIIAARFIAKQANKVELEDIVNELISARYFIESCYLLPILFSTPSQAQHLIEEIISNLESWHNSSIIFLKAAALDTTTDEYPSANVLLEKLHQATKTNNWQDCLAVFAQIYPFQLLN